MHEWQNSNFKKRFCSAAIFKNCSWLNLTNGMLGVVLCCETRSNPSNSQNTFWMLAFCLWNTRKFALFSVWKICYKICQTTYFYRARRLSTKSFLRQSMGNETVRDLTQIVALDSGWRLLAWKIWTCVTIAILNTLILFWFFGRLWRFDMQNFLRYRDGTVNFAVRQRVRIPGQKAGREYDQHLCFFHGPWRRFRYT